MRICVCAYRTYLVKDTSKEQVLHFILKAVRSMIINSWEQAPSAMPSSCESSTSCSHKYHTSGWQFHCSSWTQQSWEVKLMERAAIFLEANSWRLWIVRQTLTWTNWVNGEQVQRAKHQGDVFILLLKAEVLLCFVPITAFSWGMASFLRMSHYNLACRSQLYWSHHG